MDAVQRLELKAELLREIDAVKADVRDKASNKDVTILANHVSAQSLDHSERMRALATGLAEVDKTLKTLAAIVAADPGTPIPRNRLREIDPRILLAAALAGGAALGKSFELIAPYVLNGGN